VHRLLRPLVRLAEVPPATAAVGRCVLALPLLLMLARRETGGSARCRSGPAPWPGWPASSSPATSCCGTTPSARSAPGLATVLGNLQVLVVAVVAWWLLGERPHAGLLASVPVLLLGVALVSGALGGETYGRDPQLGVLLGLATSVAYAGFLLVLRQGSKDLRRLAGPLLWATGSAAGTGLVLAALLGELEMPSGTALLWLVVLALTSQVLGWMLISLSLPRLPAALTSVLLLAQPVGSMAISGLLLSEAPTPVQYAGTALILAGVVLAHGHAPPRGRRAVRAGRPSTRWCASRPRRRRRTGW
jgi:drug/metabolite transporter (DMT)-like permease